MTGSLHKGQRWLPFVVFCAIGLLWLPSLAGPFQFDDYNVIVSPAPAHSLAAWWQALPGLRPLLKFTYALNWTLSPAPTGFHLFNLLLHLLNGALLLAWARRTLPLAPPATLLLVALWLLHPVQTEAVTYIAGRSMALSTTFLLAGLLVLAREGSGASWWAAVCTALALAARETAWIFPVVFALPLWLRGRNARDIWTAIAPSLLVVTFAAIAFLIEPHYRQMIDISLGIRSLDAQCRAQVVAHTYLLGQIVSLSPNIDPDLRVPVAWTPALVAQCVITVTGLVVASVLVLHRRSWMAGSVIWYALLLLPTNSLMPRVDVASERHLYAALLGPLWCGVLLMQSWRWSHAVGIGFVLLFGTATVIRNEDYRSELALWARTSQQSPEKARVWNNLGEACRLAGARDCSAEAFENAIRLDPHDPTPASNLYFLRHQGTPPPPSDGTTMPGRPAAAPAHVTD